MIKFIMFSGILGALVYTGNCFSAEPEAEVSITSGVVTPKGTITVAWEGPDNPGDQIALFTTSEQVGREMAAFIYTARGNPVQFQVPGHGLHEVTYNTTASGVIATLTLDCRAGSLREGTCVIVEEPRE